MAHRVEGRVLPGGARTELLFQDGRFTREPTGEVQTLLEDAFVVPGLVDVHAHLALAAPAPDDAPPRERALASARLHRDAGVLAIREPGSPDHGSTGLGPADGVPRVVTAGRFLAPPGRYIPGLAREVDDDALPDAAVEELRAGGGAWAKVIGDFPLGQPRIIRTYSAEALAETARRVHAAGGRLAVHCTVPEVIQDAVDAGVDSLEHGSLLRADQVAAVARAGCAWVPTLTIDGAVRSMVRDLGLDEAAVRDVDAGLDRQPEVLLQAAEAGVPVLAGTDAGMGPHGLVAGEVALLLRAGLSPELALGAASWTARSWLGLPGIEDGAPADLVAYREDPRADATVLTRPALVVLDGQVVRAAA